jgi:formamidopyrimidine-DNA glycosylase
MNELPETTTLARQVNENLVGKNITTVLAAASPHKFAWYYGDPAEYPARLTDSSIDSAQAFGMMVEITLSRAFLVFSDGVHPRWHPQAGPVPKKHQLLLYFDDGSSLSGSLSMYGGLFCWDKGVDFTYDYYLIAKEKPSPLSDAFDETYFEALLAPEDVQKLSLKGVLATEQRIPGLGNGTLQDILWHAKLNPCRKVNDLSDSETETLYTILKTTLAEMTEKGGRSTEKDLFGQPGGYPVVMFSKNKGKPCPRCGDEIQKASYMGGSVYTCPTCQPVEFSQN